MKGRVQGVSFRASTAEQAGRYPGIRGYVRNLLDGRVEAVFVGSSEDVLALVAWCKHGPPAAQVTELQVIEEAIDPELAGSDAFRVLR